MQRIIIRYVIELGGHIVIISELYHKSFETLRRYLIGVSAAYNALHKPRHTRSYVIISVSYRFSLVTPPIGVKHPFI